MKCCMVVLLILMPWGVLHFLFKLLPANGTILVSWLISNHRIACVSSYLQQRFWLTVTWAQITKAGLVFSYSMLCKGLLCFSIQSSGHNCQMLSGRDWAARELNEMITWQKNEDSKQWSLGKEYLVSLFKPELSLFIVNWDGLHLKQLEESFFSRTRSLLVWEGLQSGRLSGFLSKLILYFLLLEQNKITGKLFFEADRDRKQGLLRIMQTPPTQPILSC